MSGNTQNFDANIYLQDAELFAPLLTEDLSTLPPPFTVEVPLTEADFTPDCSFPNDLDNIINFFSAGYDNGPDADRDETLTSSQFIWAAAELLASIMKGIRTTFPLSDTPAFLRSLGPDDLEGLRVFTAATAALNRYLTDPSAQNPSRWQQCLRCLQVCKITITKDDWWAEMATANQHAAAVRGTLLNRSIREFSNRALERANAERDRAWDHIVNLVVSGNPPPIDADPRITEWIEREAKRLHADMEARALSLAEDCAKVLHDQQCAVVRAHLNDDLNLLRDETDKAIAVAREHASQELADIRAQIKVERENLKAELKHDTHLAKREASLARRTACAHKRPEPLTSTTRSRAGSRRPSTSHVSPTPVLMELAPDLPEPSLFGLPSEAAQEVQMITEAACPACYDSTPIFPLFPLT
jgi:hypothetical protein